MKKMYFLGLILLSQFALSQIWVKTLDDAKKMAKATNKFILIDFNASWCQPCKMMESDFFYNQKYKENLDKFIAVSIDIDYNKDIATFYNVSSIPNVKVVDVQGNVIHEVRGYNGAENSSEEFEGYPASSENLYETLAFKDLKKPTDEELMNLATSYQVLLQKSKKVAKQRFATLSSSTFTKCSKNTKDNSIKEIAELGKFFNLAHTNSGSKVIKGLDANKISEANRSYAYYILAKSNYEENKDDEGNKYVAEIEKINDQQWVPAAISLRNKFTK